MVCSTCGQNGHNKRTCSTFTTNLLPQSIFAEWVARGVEEWMDKVEPLPTTPPIKPFENPSSTEIEIGLLAVVYDLPKEVSALITRGVFCNHLPTPPAPKGDWMVVELDNKPVDVVIREVYRTDPYGHTYKHFENLEEGRRISIEKADCSATCDEIELDGCMWVANAHFLGMGTHYKNRQLKSKRNTKWGKECLTLLNQQKGMSGTEGYYSRWESFAPKIYSKGGRAPYPQIRHLPKEYEGINLSTRYGTYHHY